MSWWGNQTQQKRAQRKQQILLKIRKTRTEGEQRWGHSASGCQTLWGAPHWKVPVNFWYEVLSQLKNQSFPSERPQPAHSLQGRDCQAGAVPSLDLASTDRVMLTWALGLTRLHSSVKCKPKPSSQGTICLAASFCPALLGIWGAHLWGA